MNISYLNLNPFIADAQGISAIAGNGTAGYYGDTGPATAHNVISHFIFSDNLRQ